MRYVPDKTGRFSQRPHYKPEELDRECENIVAAFLKDRGGKVSYPLSTDDLTVLIERDTESLDQFADLSAFGPKVEGLTLFQPGRKPKVKISARLAEDGHRQNRLRTTLAHEYGHVRFHAYLWEIEPPSGDLLKRKPTANMQICYRDTMLDAVQTDWMEWQAGYALRCISDAGIGTSAACETIHRKAWIVWGRWRTRFARPRADRAGEGWFRGFRRCRANPPD
ncbi:hypothetical protein ACVWZ3_000189 [Bradyrhizobium sp. i1.3.6]